MDQAEQKPKRVLSYTDLRERKGIKWHRVELSRKVKANKFPKPIKLGPGTLAWLETEIDAWLDQRIAERDSAA